MKYRISDVASINESSISKSTYIGSVNYVDTSSVISGNFNGYRHYPSISEAPSRARRLVSKEDTVISTVRPNMKHVGFISSKSDCIYSTGFAVVSPKKDKIDPYYLYLFLSSNRVTEVLQSIGETSTSTYPSVKPSDIGNLVIDMPPLDEQHLIANRIRLIDEKKNQNSQINANLQELRHILYKQLIAQSALKTISIKELYSIKYGKTLPKSQLLRTGTKVFGAKGFMGYTERKPLVNKATVTITSRGSGAGFVSYIDEEEAFLTNNLLYLIDKTGLGLSFTYELIKSSKPSQFVTGSAQPQLTINNLKQLKLKIPTDRFIIEQFKNNTKRIEDCMSNNKIENNSLQKLRLAFLNYYF